MLYALPYTYMLPSDPCRWTISPRQVFATGDLQKRPVPCFSKHEVPIARSLQLPCAIFSILAASLTCTSWFDRWFICLCGAMPFVNGRGRRRCGSPAMHDHFGFESITLEAVVYRSLKANSPKNLTRRNPAKVLGVPPGPKAS